ncbi:MAG: DUF1512 domain-containing protein [Candidatus Nitrosocaldus sp.]|nr:DUF1512 domain-containing protein [Candidatus Nitrosocaldus sp.]
MQMNPLFPSGEGQQQWWVYLLWIIPFFIFLLYGQRIQMWMVLNDVARSLNKLKVMQDKAREEAIAYLRSINPNASTERLDMMMEQFAITPVDMDPYGIVRKIQHIITLRDERIRAQIRMLAPQADEVTASRMENVLEVATALHMLYKVVRHFYLMGKKTTSMFFLVQLQMLMPLIMQSAEALNKAIPAIKSGQPIGDGIGPMIVGRLMLNREKVLIARDTMMSEYEYNGRRLYLVKAKGPGGTVGEPHTAVERLINEMGVRVDMIIMIDAALKLEGEKTGDVAEGVGAAIGGIGVEKYQIEEVATKHSIPLYAVIIKQSIIEAITVMKKEIAEAVDRASKSVFRMIDEHSKEGDNILIIGVGNTLGVGQ